MKARYAWDDDRAHFPVLVVGASYRHRRLGLVRIERRIGNPGGGCRYSFSSGGEARGEQNDFALLNLVDAPPVTAQLVLL